MKAFCRSSGWKLAFTMARPWGIIVAPNRPCSTRKPMRVSGLGASPQASDETAKPAMPMMNIGRRPTMSPSRADVTRPTAKASV